MASSDKLDDKDRKIETVILGLSPDFAGGIVPQIEIEYLGGFSEKIRFQQGTRGRNTGGVFATNQQPTFQAFSLLVWLFARRGMDFEKDDLPLEQLKSLRGWERVKKDKAAKTRLSQIIDDSRVIESSPPHAAWIKHSVQVEISHANAPVALYKWAQIPRYASPCLTSANDAATYDETSAQFEVDGAAAHAEEAKALGHMDPSIRHAKLESEQKLPRPWPKDTGRKKAIQKCLSKKAELGHGVNDSAGIEYSKRDGMLIEGPPSSEIPGTDYGHATRFALMGTLQKGVRYSSKDNQSGMPNEIYSQARADKAQERTEEAVPANLIEQPDSTDWADRTAAKPERLGSQLGSSDYGESVVNVPSLSPGDSHTGRKWLIRGLLSAMFVLVGVGFYNEWSSSAGEPAEKTQTHTLQLIEVEAYYCPKLSALDDGFARVTHTVNNMNRALWNVRPIIECASEGKCSVPTKDFPPRRIDDGPTRDSLYFFYQSEKLNNYPPSEYKYYLEVTVTLPDNNIFSDRKAIKIKRGSQKCDKQGESTE